MVTVSASLSVSPAPLLALDNHVFTSVLQTLLAEYRTIGPQMRDASVVLAELAAPEDLVSGVTLEQAPGSCRVVPLESGDTRRFAWAVGPQSAKQLQHPSEHTVFRAEVGGDSFRVTEEPRPLDDRPLAIVGLRPCDIAALGVLGRVLGRDGQLEDPLLVVVNCAEPGGTCFCVSMGTGPALKGDRLDAADLVVWERSGDDGPEYLVTHTSTRGEALLDRAGVQATDGPDADAEVRDPVARAATAQDAQWATDAERDAAERMGRVLDTKDLPERLAVTLGSPRWDDVAQRCLSCGNCTMVCPTCFCSSVHDTTSLDGGEVARTRRWDSCFSLDHSFVHGGSVRSDTSDRYRQWLTHKLSTWWGQFGESGCVGCGRCIAWCPVGIDLVEEANGLSDEAADMDIPEQTAAGFSITDVLVRRRSEAIRLHTPGSGEEDPRP